jgi:hypothetical protein
VHTRRHGRQHGGTTNAVAGRVPGATTQVLRADGCSDCPAQQIGRIVLGELPPRHPYL